MAARGWGRAVRFRGAVSPWEEENVLEMMVVMVHNTGKVLGDTALYSGDGNRTYLLLDLFPHH